MLLIICTRLPVEHVSQGWRLDPLLLFGQLLTSGTALAFAMEVLNLRQAKASEKVSDDDDQAKSLKRAIRCGSTRCVADGTWFPLICALPE